MKVFVKRYPEKGDFPEDGVMVYAGDGRLYYNYERKEWICANGYTHYPLFWLEEIELPGEEEIEDFAKVGAYYPFSFVEGANYILNLLKQKDNETNENQ